MQVKLWSLFLPIAYPFAKSDFIYCRLINEAYSIELGDSGVACKKLPRLLDAMEPSMRDAYAEERIIKCVHRKSEEDDSKHIAGFQEL